MTIALLFIKVGIVVCRYVRPRVWIDSWIDNAMAKANVIVWASVSFKAAANEGMKLSLKFVSSRAEPTQHWERGEHEPLVFSVNVQIREAKFGCEVICEIRCWSSWSLVWSFGWGFFAFFQSIWVISNFNNWISTRSASCAAWSCNEMSSVNRQRAAKVRTVWVKREKVEKLEGSGEGGKKSGVLLKSLARWIWSFSLTNYWQYFGLARQAAPRRG